MQNTVHTQIQSSPSPETKVQPPSPLFGAGAVRGLIEVDVDDLADRDDIRKAILKYIRETEKYRVVMIYDVGDDIFLVKPKPQRPLTDKELNELLDALGIKYEPETGDITEVPEDLKVVRIYDGFGSTYIILKKR